MSRIKVIAGLAAIILTVGSPWVCAEPAPLGDEFRLSPDADGMHHYNPQLRAVPGGGFVAAWDRSRSTAEGVEHLARVFAPDGAPLTAPVQANQQYDSRVTGRLDADRRGNFTVAWAYFGREEDGYPSRGVFARRFSASGQPLGDEFQVADVQVSSGAQVHVSMAPDGRFIVMWSQYPQEEFGLYARLYDGAGQPLGEAFRLVRFDQASINGSDLVMRGDGSFVIRYTCDGTCGGSGNDTWSSYLRGFDAAGSPAFGPVRIGGMDSYFQGLTAHAEGSLQVLSLVDSADIFLHRFTATGEKSAPPVKLNAAAADWRSGVALGTDAVGRTAVAWRDGDGQTVLARGIDRWGVPDGGPFVVGTTGIVGALDAGGIALSDSSLVVAWRCGEDYPSAICARAFGVPEESAPPLPRAEAPFGNNEVAGGSGPGLWLGFLVGAALRRRQR